MIQLFQLPAIPPPRVKKQMNAVLISIKKWLEFNELTINVTKTEYILTDSSHKLEELLGLNIFFLFFLGYDFFFFFFFAFISVIIMLQ